MASLIATLLHRGETPTPQDDAFCLVQLNRPQVRTGRNRLVQQFVKLLNAGHGYEPLTDELESLPNNTQPARSLPNTQPTRSFVSKQLAAPRTQLPAHHQVACVVLEDVPAAAAVLIWQHLPKASRRAVLVASKATHTLFSRAVSSLHLTANDVKRSSVLGQLGSKFPDLNELHLQLGNECQGLLLQLQQLKRAAGSLPHLHTFYIDSKLKDDAFHAVASFLVLSPNLQKLLLPNQRCSSAADQRVLVTLLESLPGLRHIKLGSCSSSSAISGSIWRRILRCRSLQGLHCNASALPDSQLAGLAALKGLRELSLSADGCGQELWAALQQLQQLTSLELQHPSISHLCIRGLQQLRVLSLGRCPKLRDTIISTEVSALQQLEKLTVPFALDTTHLRLLSRLPTLKELNLWREIILGDPSSFPAPEEPLLNVTRLVARSITSSSSTNAAAMQLRHSRQQCLGTWFPAVETVWVRHLNDATAKSLRGCVGLQALLAEDCGQLSDHGLAGCLRELRALQRLQLDGAGQISDAAFTAVFSSTMPVLQHISLSGCPAVSDQALQLLTASCRRLASISITSFKQLTDKTLKRLAHCEHLRSVSLKGCRGFTAEGIAALAAAPQMRTVAVNGCINVRASLCKGYRPGVKVRVEDKL